MKPYRDSLGRFAKRPERKEDNNEHRILRLLNRLADGGHEESIDDVRRNEVIARISLRVLFLIFILFMMSLVCSCSTTRQPQVVTVERIHRETVTLRDTVIRVQLVPQTDSITTTDTTSTLRNAYCQSTATVSDGHLTHTLSTLPHSTHEVEIQVREVVRTDSIPYPVPGPTQYIEKSLSPICRFLVGFGLVSIGFLAVSVARFMHSRFLGKNS
ncbi:MAG: hypothetical protein ACI36Z_10080 [Alloprevotella sp.]